MIIMSEDKVNQKAYAIIRLRGTVNRDYNLETTLKLLRLHKPNHCSIYPVNGPLEGMLRKSKDLVTWGEIDADTVEHLLKKRGELPGKQNKLTDEFVKANSDYKGIKDFAKAVASGDAKLTDIPELQPVFRLNPPKKGFKSLKYSTFQGGDLGYRGDEIKSLINRMA